MFIVSNASSSLTLFDRQEYEQQRKSTKKAAGKRSIDFVSGKNEFSKDSKYSSGDDEERIPGYIRKKKRKSR